MIAFDGFLSSREKGVAFLSATISRGIRWHLAAVFGEREGEREQIRQIVSTLSQTEVTEPPASGVGERGKRRNNGVRSPSQVAAMRRGGLSRGAYTRLIGDGKTLSN